MNRIDLFVAFPPSNTCKLFGLMRTKEEEEEDKKKPRERENSYDKKNEENYEMNSFSSQRQSKTTRWMS